MNSTENTIWIVLIRPICNKHLIYIKKTHSKTNTFLSIFIDISHHLFYYTLLQILSFVAAFRKKRNIHSFNSLYISFCIQPHNHHCKLWRIYLEKNKSSHNNRCSLSVDIHHKERWTPPLWSCQHFSAIKKNTLVICL